MAETITRLQPDRDLQCYFLQPSAVAALSQTSATGFTVSGSWRQQFDWAVVEWNRDNVFEHPTLRNLPDGNLTGMSLSYTEARTNCIALDSLWYPTVAWPYLRIWSDVSGVETIYEVPIANYASAAGPYVSAMVQFELQGTPTANDYIELAWLDQHFNYQVGPTDTLATAINSLAFAITSNQATGMVTATASGNQITLTYLGAPGSNGNRIGVYGTVHGAGTESWSPAFALFSGGQSPQAWQVSLNFSTLVDLNSIPVPVTNVRKMRWTWSADVQPASFQRSEFSVVVSNWTVSGSSLLYSVAGPGSWRAEDSAVGEISYQGTWSSAIGNFSGGSIHWTTTPGDSLRYSYTSPTAHSLYLGTRCADGGGQVSVRIDGGAAIIIALAIPGEDVLTRILLSQFSAGGNHQVVITNTGAAGLYFYFDFFEIAIPATSLPAYAPVRSTAMATDWDTLHSQALAPERTAWLIQTLGFHARENHYAGALWFYELTQPGQQYSSATVTFSGAPEFGNTTQILLGATSISLGATSISHTNLIGDTAQSIATCFALLIDAGSTGVWAEASGAMLTITARAMGTQGESINVTVITNSTAFTAVTSSAALAGGVNGTWLTDLTVTPRINRAARDWSTSFFQALSGYGISVTTSFSMEIGNGDDTVATGIAQRYPDGDAVWVNTPALQTNFSPASTAFWRQVYADMAGLMAGAGVTPYLQFGEVQWWYFADDGSGMPFYDAYTTSTFQSQYGRAMSVILSPNADPATLTQECIFLPSLIGQFTSTIREFVRQTYSTALFEVLYPHDVNNTALNRVINYPVNDWTATNLACLKTENFTYTGDRDLDLARQSIDFPALNGFPPGQSSHLIGITDYTTPWAKERSLAIAAGDESVVLFALDQFCLIGYGLPLSSGPRRASFMGS
jgi:hypothetical protein